MRKYELKVKVRSRDVYAENIEQLERAIYNNPMYFFSVEIIDKSSVLFSNEKSLDSYLHNPFFE